MSDSKLALSFILNTKQIASPTRSRHTPCATSISPRAQADKCVNSNGLTDLSEVVALATYKRTFSISKTCKMDDISRCCRVTGCGNQIVSRGLCVKHGVRMIVHLDRETIPKRSVYREEHAARFQSARNVPSSTKDASNTVRCYRSYIKVESVTSITCIT